MSKRTLSKAQRVQIGIAASAAFARLDDLDLIECPPDLRGASKSARAEFWRHQQVSEVTQRVCRISDCIDDEYLAVKQHFESLAGGKVAAQAAATTARLIGQAACHRPPGCDWLRDMYDWMVKAGFKPGYMFAIMKGKFRGETKVENLTELQLKALHDTVVNRCRAKLGLGELANRNKKQRRGRKK